MPAAVVVSCVVVVTSLLAACGTGEEGLGASPPALEDCDTLIAAGLINDLSDDRVLAGDQRFRTEAGFRNDLEWVTHLREIGADSYGHEGPLHPDEYEMLVSPDHAAFEDARQDVEAYGVGHPDTFGGVRILRYPEPHLEVGFTDDIEHHHNALTDLLAGTAEVEVVSSPHTDVEARAVARDVAGALEVRRTGKYRVSDRGIVRTGPGHHRIEVVVTDRPGANLDEATAAIPDGAHDMFCTRLGRVPQGGPQGLGPAP